MSVRDRSNWQGWSDSRIRAESRFGEAVREGETALCLDCLVTFSVRNRTCPKCGGEQFWLMAKWMQAPVRTRPVAVPFPEERASRGPMRLRHASRGRPGALFKQFNILPDRRLGQGEDGRAALTVPAPRANDLGPLRRVLRNHFAPATSFWNLGLLRSGSKLGSILSQAGVRK
jgi:hypothetical protein